MKRTYELTFWGAATVRRFPRYKRLHTQAKTLHATIARVHGLLPDAGAHPPVIYETATERQITLASIEAHVLIRGRNGMRTLNIAVDSQGRHSPAHPAAKADGMRIKAVIDIPDGVPDAEVIAKHAATADATWIGSGVSRPLRYEELGAGRIVLAEAETKGESK